jgi:hypothetical protein
MRWSESNLGRKVREVVDPALGAFEILATSNPLAVHH